MNNSDDKNKVNNAKSKNIFPISLNLKGIGLEKTVVVLSILLLVIVAIASVFHSVIVPITKNNTKINDQLYNAYAHVDDFQKEFAHCEPPFLMQSIIRCTSSSSSSDIT